MRCTRLILAAALVCTPILHAQSPAPSTAAMAPSAALDDLLNMLQKDSITAAKTMPAELYGFKPTQAVFATNQKTAYPADIRTFAQQISHLAGANYYFFSTITGVKPSVDMKTLSAMTDKAQLVSALEASFVYAHQAIATITPDNAFLTIKGADGMHTRTTTASFAVAHGFDHYGQMVEYLRMNGYAPPAM